MKAVADALGGCALEPCGAGTARRKPAATAISQSRRRRAAGAHPAPVDARPSYGYRRITALLNGEADAAGLMQVNHKRVYRVMKRVGLLLAAHTGRGRQRPHDCEVAAPASNQGWDRCARPHAARSRAPLRGPQGPAAGGVARRQRQQLHGAQDHRFCLCDPAHTVLHAGP
jgi:HTH-like domain